MALDIFATAGALIYIGPATARKSVDFVLGDFEGSPAISWTLLGMVEDQGQFGDASQVINFIAVDQNREIKIKGTNNSGNMALVLGLKEDDAGQIALEAAQKTKNNYSFKVVFNNMPAGGTSGAKRYFIGMVMGTPENLGTANNVVKLQASIELNSNIVKVVAV